MKAVRYLFITTGCFGAFAYFASNGSGYLATGALAFWYFLISASTGQFNRKRSERKKFDDDDASAKNAFGRDIHGNFSPDGMFGDD